MNDTVQKRLIRQGWYATLLDRALRVAPDMQTALQAADMAFAQMPTPPEEVEIESVLSPMGDGGGAGSGAVSQPGDFAPEPRPPSPRGTKKTAGKGKGRSRRLARGLRLSKKWRSYKPLELQLSAEDWRQFKGPRGGVGWQNVRTGEVLYQQERPGGSGGQQQQTQPKPAAGQTAPPRKSVSSPVSSLAEQLPGDEDLRRGSFASFGVESQHQVAIGKVKLGSKDYFFKDGMDEEQEWSEVVASKVGAYMGIAMPMARKSEVEFNGNRGIVTNWVNGKTVYEMSDAEKDSLDQKEVDRHVLFSYLMDVDDRHLGNYMVSDGRLVSIDHESFLKYTVYKPTTDAIANNDLYYAKTESDQFDRAIAGELAAKTERAAAFLQKVGADEKRVSWVRKRGQVLKEFSQSNDNSVRSLNNIHKQIFSKELAQ